MENFLSRCLLCTCTPDVTPNLHIFSEAGNQLQLAEKIKKYLNIQILTELPQNMCCSCMEKLEVTHELVTSSQQAWVTLLRMGQQNGTFEHQEKQKNSTAESESYQPATESWHETSMDIEKNNDSNCPTTEELDSYQPATESSAIFNETSMDTETNISIEEIPTDNSVSNRQAEEIVPSDSAPHCDTTPSRDVPANKGSKNRSLKCDKCSNFFFNPNIMTWHTKFCHGVNAALKIVKIGAKQEEHFQCTFCESLSKNMLKMIKHLRDKHDFKPLPFPCKTCDRTYDCKYTLKSHQSACEKSHNKCFTKKHRCDDCEKNFAYPEVLDWHVTHCHGKHSIVKLVKVDGYLYNQCSFCKRQFCEITEIISHLRGQHRLAKLPYCCTACGKQFVKHDKLKKHKLACEHIASDQDEIQVIYPLENVNQPVINIGQPKENVHQSSDEHLTQDINIGQPIENVHQHTRQHLTQNSNICQPMENFHRPLDQHLTQDINIGRPMENVQQPSYQYMTQDIMICLMENVHQLSHQHLTQGIAQPMQNVHLHSPLHLTSEINVGDATQNVRQPSNEHLIQDINICQPTENVHQTACQHLTQDINICQPMKNDYQSSLQHLASEVNIGHATQNYAMQNVSQLSDEQLTPDVNICQTSEIVHQPLEELLTSEIKIEEHEVKWEPSDDQLPQKNDEMSSPEIKLADCRVLIPKLLECELCCFYTDNNVQLATHVQNHQAENASDTTTSSRRPSILKMLLECHTPVPEPKKERINIKCFHCDEKFRFYANLESHCRNNHPGKFIFKCEACDVTFSSRCSFGTHQKYKHNSISVFTCKTCSATFSVPHNLQAHMRLKHTQVQEEFSCTLCTSKFKYKRYLQNHVRNVHTNSLQSCENCNFTTRYKSRLKNHVQRLHLKIIQNS